MDILLLKEILFLSLGFSFLAMSRSSHIQFDQFVSWNIHTVVFPHFCFLTFVALLCVLVTISVIGYCNKPFFALFNVVLDSFFFFFFVVEGAIMQSSL